MDKFIIYTGICASLLAGILAGYIIIKVIQKINKRRLYEEQSRDHFGY